MDLITIGGLILGFGLAVKFLIFLNKKHSKFLNNLPYPVYSKAVPSTTCSSKNLPHKWEHIDMVDATKGKVVSTPICLDCGVISGTANQFNGVNLEKIKKHLVKVSENKAFEKELKEFRESELNRLADEFAMWANKNVAFVSYKDAFLAGDKASYLIDRAVSSKMLDREKKQLKEAVESYKTLYGQESKNNK